MKASERIQWTVEKVAMAGWVWEGERITWKAGIRIISKLRGQRFPMSHRQQKGPQKELGGPKASWKSLGERLEGFKVGREDPRDGWKDPQLGTETRKTKSK